MHVKSAIPKRTAPLEDLEDGTEVYCLRVPRGYDINLLKVYLIINSKAIFSLRVSQSSRPRTLFSIR